MKRTLQLVTCYLLLATLAASQVAVKYTGPGANAGRRSEPATYKVPTGFSDTYEAGSTLTLNGTLNGTPEGGTFNLSNVTVTLPSTHLTAAQVDGYFADPSTNGSFSASAWRTDLSLVPGTDVQAFAATLTSWASITRAAGFDTFTATPSSANLAGLLTDEAGTGGGFVRATSPTITTPTLAGDVRQTVSGASSASAAWTPSGSNFFLGNDGLVRFRFGSASSTASSAVAASFSRARGTLASPSTVASGDALGGLFWGAHDGSQILFTAAIEAEVASAPSSGSVPTAIKFMTGSDGTRIERGRVDNSGFGGVGTNLTALNATALSNGTLPPSRLKTLTPAVYPAGDRMGLNIIPGFSGGALSIRRHNRNGATALTNIFALLPNWYVTESLVETAGSNALRIRMSIECPKGTTPVHFTKNGSEYIVVNAGETVRTDYLDFEIPANTDFWIHYYISPWDGSAESVGFVPYGRDVLEISGTSKDDQYARAFPGVDKTGDIGGETTPSGASGTFYDPIFVGGTPADPTAKSFIAIGDSITQKDDGVRGDTNGRTSMWGRWLTGVGGYGLVNLGRSSAKASTWVKLARGEMPLTEAAIRGIGSHTVVMLGTNDLSDTAGALSYLDVVANVQELVDWLRTKQRRVYVTTIPPRTGSTDSWATTTNQSFYGPTTAYVSRLAYNQYIRAGYFTGAAGYIDAASVYESSLDSGKWQVPTYTADGLHPNYVALGAFAAAGLTFPE